MADHANDRPDAHAKSERADAILRWVVVGLVAVLIGFAAFFGYTIWQTRQAEGTATPALRAIRGLEDLVRKNPNSAAARVRLGEAYAAAGSIKAAQEQLAQAVKIDPKHTGAWLDLGVIAMDQKQRSEAEKYFLKVVDLTEGSKFEDVNARREQALFHLGEITLDDHRYADSATYFKGALRIRKDASDTYYLLASALRGVGDDDAALKQLDAALAFDPNYPEAHNLYGEILLSKGDRINAAIHFRKAVDLAPDVRLPKDNLAKLGKVEDAIAQGRKALSDGNAAAALDAALLARAIDPANTDATLLYVDVLVSRKEQAIAVTTLKDALKQQPNDAALKKKLAELEPAAK
jgi:tetratricopeptide (TPR) repeat protein